MSTLQTRIWDSSTFKVSYNTIIRFSPLFNCMHYMTWYVIAFHCGNGRMQSGEHSYLEEGIVSSRKLLFAQTFMCVHACKHPHAAGAGVHKSHHLIQWGHFRGTANTHAALLPSSESQFIWITASDLDLCPHLRRWNWYQTRRCLVWPQCSLRCWWEEELQPTSREHARWLGLIFRTLSPSVQQPDA